MTWRRSGSDEENSVEYSDRSSHSSSREPRDGITLADTEEDSYDNESDSTGSLIDFIVDEGEVEEEERRPKRRGAMKNSGKYIFFCFKGNSALNRTSSFTTGVNNNTGSHEDNKNAVVNPRHRRIVYVDSEEDTVPLTSAVVVVKNEQTVPLPMPAVVKQEGIVAFNSPSLRC